MIISYPANPSRIIVLLKNLRHTIDKLKKKVKERNAALEKTVKKGVNNKKGAKTFRRGPCTVRPIQFSIFSTIFEKSHFVSVKGLLFIFELTI